MIRVLYIDDDVDAHRLLRITLPEGYTLISGLDARRGLKLASESDPDVILLDVDLPDANGLDVLDRISQFPAAAPIIVITGYAEIPLAVRSIQAGAADFIEKPYGREYLLKSIQKAARIRGLAEATPTYGSLNGFAGESRASNYVRERIARYANSTRPVLITGESGSGKDLAARLIHQLSPRCEGPFVAKNCGAIPSLLVESELFGSEKGAFTDAVEREGSFEKADGGTLFLDEIGELPVASQATLLRVVEDKLVHRVGSRRPRRVDVRIVSATNRNAAEMIRAGLLRRDLYYRVSTLLLHIPSLRQRREDIPMLVQRCLSAAGRTISRDALMRLVEYDWPGNVRELHNVVERAAILSDADEIAANRIQFDDLGLIDFADMEGVENRDRSPVFHVEKAKKGSDDKQSRV